MKTLLCITLVLFGGALALLPSFEEALENNGALLKLYRSHVAHEHLPYLKNNVIRVTTFRKSVAKIVDINNADLGWTAGLTHFATLTEAEKALYVGRNASVVNAALQISGVPEAPARTAGSVDWRSRGAVSPIRSQYGGTCWSYSSTHALEGRYATLTGRLQEFTPQLLVDCVYGGNGFNNGGMQNDAFDWIRQNQIVPGWSDYRPVNRANRCNKSRPNRMTGVRFDGYSRIGKTAAALAAALNISPTTTNYHVSDSNYYYTGGFYSDPRCKSGFYDLNHAVTAVGYTSNSFIVKNSWGTNWGDRGFGYWRRTGTGCGLFQDNLQVRLSRRVEEEEE